METTYHWMLLAMRTYVHLRRQDSPTYSPGICSCLMFLTPDPTPVPPRPKGCTVKTALNIMCPVT